MTTRQSGQTWPGTPAPPHNLPPVYDPFVGREKERRAIHALTETDRYRLHPAARAALPSLGSPPAFPPQ